MRSWLFGTITIALVGCSSSGHWGTGATDTPTSGGSPTPGIMPPSAASPSFGSTVTAASAPPPISGGTIAVAGSVVVVADPDRDEVSIVSPASRSVTAKIPLLPGDEPGRVAVDAKNRAHVALRGSGYLLTIDLTTTTVLARRNVCPAPRGVAVDGDNVHVACATGELVTLPTAGGDPVRKLSVGMDLRDIVVQANGDLLVSQFRSAQTLTVGPDGKVKTYRRPPDLVAPFMMPSIAWRMIPRSAAQGRGDGGIVVHQRASGAIDNHSAATQKPGTSSAGGGGYTSMSGGCGSFTQSTDAVAASITDFGATTKSLVVPGLVLPVDIAMSPNGERLVVVSAGNGHANLGTSLFSVDAARIPDGVDGCSSESPMRQVPGQLTSVAFLDDMTVVALAREPAELLVVPLVSSDDIQHIQLSTVSREDTGHAVFHSNTGAGIACASCHAEGGEDGLVWTFTEQGRRRTPSLRGTLQGTAPYHWNGDLGDTPALVQKVYEEGMGGPVLASDQVDALRTWLFAVPRPPVVAGVDASAAERGRALFEGTAGCSTCHNGPRMTNNATVNVGTGGAFQVPSLVGVSHRAPYLHDGCAATLQDRFGPCGGAGHGNVSALTADDVSDVVQYLHTL